MNTMGSPGDEFDRGFVEAVDKAVETAWEWTKETVSDAVDFATGGDEAPSDPDAGSGGAGGYSGGDGGAEGAGGQ
jgi:hypothetical protein